MGIPTESPIIRPSLLLSYVVVVIPFVTTLEEVTLKDPIEAPVVRAPAIAAAALVVVPVEVPDPDPADGSAVPPTVTDPRRIVVKVITSTRSVLILIALRRKVTIVSITESTVATSVVPRVKLNPTLTLF
jgi:hypothetical protein